MEVTHKTKRAFMSEKQKKLLIQCVKSNEQLITGKFTANYTHKMAQEQWQEIAQELNAVPGANKNWVQWKKTWTDIKKNAKKKNSEITKYMRGTGGGPQPPENITEDEEAVLELIEPIALEGDPNVLESDIQIASYETPDDQTTTGNELAAEEVPETSKKAQYALKLPPAKRSKKIALKAQNLQRSIQATMDLLKENENMRLIQESYYKENIQMKKENLMCRKEEIQLKKEEIKLKKDLIAATNSIVDIVQELF